MGLLSGYLVINSSFFGWWPSRVNGYVSGSDSVVGYLKALSKVPVLFCIVFLNPKTTKTMFQAMHPLLLTLLAITTSISGLSWGDTRFLVTFGDSYTTDGEPQFMLLFSLSLSLFHYRPALTSHGSWFFQPLRVVAWFELWINCWLLRFNISSGVDSPILNYVCSNLLDSSESSATENVFGQQWNFWPQLPIRLHQTVLTGSKNLVSIKYIWTSSDLSMILGSTYNVNQDMQVII